MFTWNSTWFADEKSYSKQLLEDKRIRRFFEPRLKTAGLVKVEIERSINATKIRLYVARPGVVIGKGGSHLEELKEALAKELKGTLRDPNGQKLVIDAIVE
ncbi:MAG: KH domain-containing protein, partial [Patescibacteria group bacterium]